MKEDGFVRNTMKKNIALIMLITILSKFIGFFREIALTYFYGASATSDVYLVAQSIPVTFFGMIGAGIAVSFIPVYNNALKAGGKKEANAFTSRITNLVFLISTLIVAVVLLFTKPVVMLFASGFSSEVMDMAVSFTRITIFAVYFTGALAVFNAYLQIHNSFLVTAFLGIPMNFVAIISFFIASKSNDHVLAYGVIASYIIQMFILIPEVLKHKFNYTPLFSPKNEYVKALLILAIPVILSTSVNQINVLVDKNIASNITTGGISALNYANRLFGFIQGLFVAPIITVIYPNISRMVVDNKEDGVKKTLHETIVTVSLLVIPATIGAMIFAEPIVNFLFLRGQFDAVAAAMTSDALFYYALGLLPFSLWSIINIVFYSYNDTKTPMILGFVSVVLNVALNLLLSYFIGIGGLALASSISSIVTTILLLRSLRKKMPTLKFRNTATTMVKILAMSLLMGLMAFGTYGVLHGTVSDNLALVLSVGVGVIVYGLSILLLKIPEVESILSLGKEKLKNLRNRGR